MLNFLSEFTKKISDFTHLSSEIISALKNLPKGRPVNSACCLSVLVVYSRQKKANNSCNEVPSPLAAPEGLFSSNYSAGYWRHALNWFGADSARGMC
jgi:hypothetical protein